MTLAVELVQPEGELWAGNASLVIARTLDGEIGVMTNHAPVIGILYEGSVVQIRPDNPGQPDVFAAVSGGFLSVADNRVSILARSAQLGRDVDTARVEAALADEIQSHPELPGAPEEPADMRYYHALLRAAEQTS